jgi:hypothetical protein
LDGTEGLTFYPIGIAVEDKEYGAKHGTLVCVAEMTNEIALSGASDLMNAANPHRRVIEEELSLVLGRE